MVSCFAFRTFLSFAEHLPHKKRKFPQTFYTNLRCGRHYFWVPLSIQNIYDDSLTVLNVTIEF